MYIVDVDDAEARLSALLNRLEEGEEIIITKAGRPAARLVPVNRGVGERSPGTAKGKIVMERDFDEPLPESLLSEFER